MCSSSDVQIVRDLWCKSSIDIDIGCQRKPSSKMVLRVDESYEDKPFILKLLNSVCYRTGMPMVAVYGKENVQINLPKEKHYLVAVLEIC